MAAYAAVRSLMRLFEGIMDDDPEWVLQNKLQIEVLQEKFSILSHFLEEHSVPDNEVVRDLEIKIRDIAYMAEDIIETYVSDLSVYCDEEDKELSYQTFCRALEIVTEEIFFIQEEALAIRCCILELNSLQQIIPLSMDRSKLVSSGKNSTDMLGFDDELIKIKDWLTSSSSKLEVISIVGMGGIGKTTLARNVFDEPLTAHHFDIQYWVTVSQEYQAREILAGLLRHLTGELSQESEEKLAERLYKSLKGRRYLIVMDDLWETKAWDDVKRLFPVDNNGSRIILTTRITGVGVHAASSNHHVHNLRFLSLNESWDLLCKKVFGKESCPHYLVEVGQEIARCCRGLPLSIVVVGGLLSMDKTFGYWATMATSMNSVLAMDDCQCSKILSISYGHLPVHLKPCFLYFGVFPEDREIRRSKLVKLWVAEGLLKPDNSNRLEDIAERYLEDLVNRSLIMVFKLGYSGKVESYRMHDLLRDFCIKEAQKEKFLHFINRRVSFRHEVIQSERRVSIHPNIPFEHYIEYIYNSKPTLLTRSLQCFNSLADFHMFKLVVRFRLLRVLDMTARIWFNEFPVNVVGLVHLRYLSLSSYNVIVPASISWICGLQTIVIHRLGVCFSYLPLEMWKMQYLRHVHIKKCHLPDPPFTNFVAHADLQTLSTMINFRFAYEVIARVPKLKKLKVSYEGMLKDWPHYHLSNIVCLSELETLQLNSVSRIAFPPNFKFPWSLKKLTLSGCFLPWEALTIAGSLPNLEVLILRRDACKGAVWEPNEGEFRELKVLKLYRLGLLVHWRADDSHFLKLKHLTISMCSRLKEIPIEIGNIQTLELIKVDGVNPFAVASAKRILDEQRNFGNDVLRVRIK